MVPIKRTAAVHSLFDIGHHIIRLLLRGFKLPAGKRISRTVLCPKGFFLSTCVIADHGVCCIQNGLCGTVILLQLHDLRAFKMAFKA